MGKHEFSKIDVCGICGISRKDATDYVIAHCWPTVVWVAMKRWKMLVRIICSYLSDGKAKSPLNNPPEYAGDLVPGDLTARQARWAVQQAELQRHAAIAAAQRWLDGEDKSKQAAAGFDLRCIVEAVMRRHTLRRGCSWDADTADALLASPEGVAFAAKLEEFERCRK